LLFLYGMRMAKTYSSRDPCMPAIAIAGFT
jgi:hypothetical protein